MGNNYLPVTVMTANQPWLSSIWEADEYPSSWDTACSTVPQVWFIRCHRFLVLSWISQTGPDPERLAAPIDSSWNHFK